MENKYLRISINGLDIVVKLEEEGLVLDVFEGDECVASVWELYSEMNVIVTHF